MQSSLPPFPRQSPILQCWSRACSIGLSQVPLDDPPSPTAHTAPTLKRALLSKHKYADAN